MNAVLVVPKSKEQRENVSHERTRLTWAADHSVSSDGLGVMLYPDGSKLSGNSFWWLRDFLGAYIETDDPERLCRALGLLVGTQGIFEKRLRSRSG